MNTRRIRKTGKLLGALILGAGLLLALLALLDAANELKGSHDLPPVPTWAARAEPSMFSQDALVPLAPEVTPPLSDAAPAQVAAAPQPEAGTEDPRPQRPPAQDGVPYVKPQALLRTPGKDVSPPTSPQAISVYARSDVAVDVTWGTSTDDVGVDAYEVIRQGAEPFLVTTASFTDSGLSPRAEYCYTVVAIDAAGNRSAPSDSACAVTLDILPPTIPDHVKATVADSSTILIRWAPSTDEFGGVQYEVLDNGVVIATVDSVSWRHANVEPRSEHRYAVRAVDDAGNRSMASQTTYVSLADGEPPSKPGDLTVDAFSSRLSIRWTPSTDDVAVVAYEVLEGEHVLLRSPGTTASLSGLGAYEERCLSVRAVDAAGNRSMPTPPVCARTLPRERTEGDRRVVTMPGVHRRRQQ